MLPPSLTFSAHPASFLNLDVVHTFAEEGGLNRISNGLRQNRCNGTADGGHRRLGKYIQDRKKLVQDQFLKKELSDFQKRVASMRRKEVFAPEQI